MSSQKNELETHQTPSKSPTPPSGLFHSTFKKFSRFFNRLGIRKKITYGYTITLGIAILGTIIGYAIEESYKNLARKQLNFAQAQSDLILKLQDAMLEAKSNRQQMIFFVGKSEEFKQQYTQVISNLEQAKIYLSETQNMMDLRQLHRQNFYHFNHPDSLKQKLNEYQQMINLYEEKVADLLQEILKNPPKTPQEINQTQRKIIEFTNQDIAVKFTKMSRDLLNIVDNFKQEEREEFRDYREAELIGSMIRIGSLLISIIIAVILAVYTSGTIAHPLEVTTKLAQKVTEESNFTLQAPVTTEDEVGLLTVSLNQLIQRVNSYTRELQKTQAQLIQTEKMSSLGNMVAGIAHEINNPVSFIYGNLAHTEEYMEQLLNLLGLFQQEFPTLTPQIKEEIERIDLEFIAADFPKTLESMKNGAERIRQLVLSLRNFSRLDESQRKKVNIHQGIDSTLEILNSRISGMINIVKNYEENLPKIECYPAQINQVFMNIISNSIDALLTQDKINKCITITTKRIDNERIQVSFSDNGVGISPDIQDKIFDPFFTTKPVGMGTGLGLSIAYEIVGKHQGSLSVNTALDRGTELTIILPIILSETPSDSAEIPQKYS